MRVLVVEDNTAKQERLSDLVFQAFKTKAEFANNISAAYAIVESNTPTLNLIVLDMTFQSTSGIESASKKHALAGLQLLQFMESLEIRIPVVVATQHSIFSDPPDLHIDSIAELDELLSNEFPDIYRGTILVNLGNENWHEDFLALIRSSANA